MNDIQHYLQDLLTIDCDIQTNLQSLLTVTSRHVLESSSSEIKSLIKEFKEKLDEMKDYCDSFNSGQFDRNSIISRLTGQSGSSSQFSMSSSSPQRDLFINEYTIQKEHLITLETRYRNAYLAAQNKLNQMERDSLMVTNSTSSDVKKRAINNQMLLKQNTEMTSKLHDINKLLKSIDSQASEIVPQLDESSKSIQNVSQEFGMMRMVINDSKRLLIRLNRREFTDKLLIVLCLVFFFSVVFYIIWKRLF